MTRRFYKTVSTCKEEGGFAVVLDERFLRTPAKQKLIVPTQKLADVLAEEWQAQKEQIKPDTMPMMRLAATALDRVQAHYEATLDAFGTYAHADLLCYRADTPQELVAHQAKNWDPVLDWAQRRYDISFTRITGIIPQPQAPQTIARLQNSAQGNVFRLTGLAHGAALLGSAVLVLALEAGEINASRAFELSQLDELFQITQWGEDDEAKSRLEKIKLEINNLSRYLLALKT